MSVSDFATPKPASISIFSLSKTSKEEEGIEPFGLIAGPPFVPKRNSSFLIGFCKLIYVFTSYSLRFKSFRGKHFACIAVIPS